MATLRFNCGFCGISMASEAEFERHVMNHFMKIKSETKSGLKIEKTEAVDDFSSAVIKSETLDRENFQAASSSDNRSAPVCSQRSVYKTNLTCSDCEFVSLSKDEYEDHLQKAHKSYSPWTLDPPPTSCKLCRRKPPSYRRFKCKCLRNLCFDPESNVFSCPLCYYNTSRCDMLRRHMSVHLTEKKWKCQYCQYKGADQSYLKKHLVRVHNE